MEQSPWKAGNCIFGQEILISCETWTFITVFKMACHGTLSWARWIQSITHTIFPWHSFEHYPPIHASVSQVVSFSQVFWQNSACISHLSPCVLHTLPISPSWIDHLNNVLWWVLKGSFLLCIALSLRLFSVFLRPDTLFSTICILWNK